jgi:hypothetical protein
MHPNKKKSFTNKSDPVVRDYIEDLRAKDTKYVHIARCLKPLGDHRAEVVYCVGDKGFVAQVNIPGRFRGKAKRQYFVDTGSYLLISETGVEGSVALEMIAILSDAQLDEIKKISPIDERVASKEIDKDTIQAPIIDNRGGFEFDHSGEKSHDNSVNIDDI